MKIEDDLSGTWVYAQALAGCDCPGQNGVFDEEDALRIKDLGMGSFAIEVEAEVGLTCTLDANELDCGDTDGSEWLFERA